MSYDEFTSDTTEQTGTQSDLTNEFADSPSMESQLEGQPSTEEYFAQRIDSMSLEDLKNTQEGLTQLGFGNNNEVVDQYVSQMEEQRRQQEFDRTTQTYSSSEQLKIMREELLKGNADLADIFGLNDTTEEGGFQKIIPT